MITALLPVVTGGVTLRGGGPILGGITNTEQLERAVRDINRLESTLENALPANLRAFANASQIWSPLDEEQEREEAEVNAAVAAATQEERKAREQLAAARAQAAAVGARRHVRRFVNAGLFSGNSSPPPSAAAPPGENRPAAAGASQDKAQVAQRLALEAQEAGRAALHAATLAMRMAAFTGDQPGEDTQLAHSVSSRLPTPLPGIKPELPPAESEAAHIGEALNFESRPTPVTSAAPASEEAASAADRPPPAPDAEAAARAAMRRAANGLLTHAPDDSPSPLPLPSPRVTAPAVTPPPLVRTGSAGHWMVRLALWGYLLVMGVLVCAGATACMVRLARLAARALRRCCGCAPEAPPPLDAALGLADGLDAARAQQAEAAQQVPAPPGERGQQVMDLLRSGKQQFSVSESREVANFLARQKDLLILCGKK